MRSTFWRRARWWSATIFFFGVYVWINQSFSPCCEEDVYSTSVDTLRKEESESPLPSWSSSLQQRIGSSIVNNEIHPTNETHTQQQDGMMETVLSTASEQRPQGLRVAFVGDSTTRYTYLSLVYYLTYGSWPSSGDTFLEKVKDKDPNSWNEWLHRTNDQLRPMEDCNCYRLWRKKFKWNQHCENRYFHDPTSNNSISFFTKFGGSTLHGHWNATSVFAENNAHSWNTTKRPYQWVHDTWNDFIEEYLGRMTPKPDYLIFNQGHWKEHELRSSRVLQSMQASLKKTGIQGIYRTTTFRSDETSLREFSHANFRNHDFGVCSVFPCINVSWTALTPKDEYIDPVHFKAPTNNRMAQQILETLVGKQQQQQPSD